MLGAGRDWVVSLKAQQKFFDRISSPIKELEVFPAAYHAIFHERDRHRIVDRVRKFILERFAQAVRRAFASKRGPDRTHLARIPAVAQKRQSQICCGTRGFENRGPLESWDRSWLAQRFRFRF